MKKIGRRATWYLFLLVFATTAIYLPLGAIAGSLEPSGPPGPTMKTLDEISISWDKIIPSNQRFLSLWNWEAFLDKETNLVWQTYRTTVQYTYFEALTACWTATYGGRFGWRLPTVAEIMTLFDPNFGGYPWWFDNLPMAGQAAMGWVTLDSDPTDNTKVFYVSNGSDSPVGVFSHGKEFRTFGIICVRGGIGR